MSLVQFQLHFNKFNLNSFNNIKPQLISIYSNLSPLASTCSFLNLYTNSIFTKLQNLTNSKGDKTLFFFKFYFLITTKLKFLGGNNTIEYLEILYFDFSSLYIKNNLYHIHLLSFSKYNNAKERFLFIYLFIVCLI